MGFAVYIATTAGPVRIERIIGEPVPQSNVFVGRGYKPLEPVSSDYEAFVASGGPVEKAFGPFETPSFRIDVSGPIDTGNSWELAVFVAHGLAKVGRLAGLDEAANAIILLSGRVDADLDVDAVGHVAEKLRAAEELISECRSRDCPYTFFLPAEDQASLPTDQNIDTRSVTNAMEVLKFLNVMEAEEKSRAPIIATQASNEGAGVRNLLLGLVALMVIGGGGYAITHGRNTASDKPPERAAPKAKQSSVVTSSGPVIKIFERRAPKGKSCIDVQFGDLAAQELMIETTANEIISSSQLSDICGLRIEVLGAGSEFQGEATLRVLSGRYLGQDKRENKTFFKGQAEWVLDLPLRMEKALRISVSAVGRSDGGGAVQITHQVLP